MPSVDVILENAPIACVLSANDADKGQLFRRRVNPLLPQKIFIAYTIIKKIYDNSNLVVGVLAVGTVTLLGIGNTGDDLEVFVNDPDLGSISLGKYTQQSTDTNTSIMATNVAATINNSHGYTATSSASDVLITARTGLGSSINGSGRLTVVITNN